MGHSLLGTQRRTGCVRLQQRPGKSARAGRSSRADLVLFRARMLRSAAFVIKGLREFTRGGYERSARSFDASDLPPPAGTAPAAAAAARRGKTAVVTGANAGLGLATATALAGMGMRTLCVCRNKERGMAAVDKIRAETGNDDVHLRVCDVSSLSAVRQLASSLVEEGPVHVLVNNAGVLLDKPARSAEGLDSSFATNTLGGFALTELAMPALRAAADAESADSEKDSEGCFMPRVVTISSGGMYSEGLETDDLQNARMAKHWNGVKAYALDKRRQVAMTESWAQKYADTGVTFVSMHPGWADTPGIQNALPGFSERMDDKMRTPEMGADTIVWLAAVDAAKLQSGAFYLDRKVAKKHLLLSGTRYSPGKREELYKKLMTFVDASEDAAEST